MYGEVMTRPDVSSDIACLATIVTDETSSLQKQEMELKSDLLLDCAVVIEHRHLIEDTKGEDLVAEEGWWEPRSVTVLTQIKYKTWTGL